MNGLSKEKSLLLEQIYVVTSKRDHNRFFYPVESRERELNVAEYVFLAANSFREYVFNDGYSGFVLNTEGRYVDFLPIALAAIGAVEASTVARQAAAKYVQDPEDVDALAQFDEPFWKCCGRLDELLVAYAESQSDQLPDPDEGTTEVYEAWVEQKIEWDDIKRKRERASRMEQKPTDAESILAAAQRGDRSAVEALLDQNPSLIKAKKPRSEETALHLAATYGHADVVRLLIDRGANVNAHAVDRYTPLASALRSTARTDTGTDEHGQAAIAKLIRKAGGT